MNCLNVTPSISKGFCRLKKMPKFARSSGDRVLIDFLLHSIEPCIIVYLGCPMMVSANELLPEPLGPMITVVDPGAIVIEISVSKFFCARETERFFIESNGFVMYISMVRVNKSYMVIYIVYCDRVFYAIFCKKQMLCVVFLGLLCMCNNALDSCFCR